MSAAGAISDRGYKCNLLTLRETHQRINQKGSIMGYKPTLKFCSSFLVALATLPCIQPALADVYIGDPIPGGIAYHLDFVFNNLGTLSATTGQTLTPIGNLADAQDFNGDLKVDEVGVKSWRDNIDPDFAGPIPASQYGWALNSRWIMLDLNPLQNQGYSQVKVNVTLQADATGANGTADLISAFTVWQGLELTNPVTTTDKWYPNASTSNNWSDWWATNLKASAQVGQVWWAADDTNNPTHSISLELPTQTLAGSNNYLTLVFGGNNFGPTQFTFANFKATVSVEAVPIPGAVWLFMSSLGGIAMAARRKSLAQN